MESESLEQQLKDLLIGHRIKRLEEDSLVLDNGMKIGFTCIDQDCCAWAGGTFRKVKLDAAITDVQCSDPESFYVFGDGEEFETNMTITIMHNQNVIAQGEGSADAGNGGYYYSVCGLKVTSINGESLDEIYLFESEPPESKS